MTLLQRLSITVVFITMAATDSALYSARVLLSRLRLAHAHADLRAGHLYQKEKTRLEALIDEHIDRYSGLKQDRALLESIPSVGPVISQQMVGVLRSRTFKTASQCAAFLGLIPVQHESGSSVCGRPRLSKHGNEQQRTKLYMAATVATRHNPDIKSQHERLSRHGKSRMSALGAAMRKLVQICFGVLKHQIPYLPQVT
jgi:transposase